ncbi:MAG: transcriptional repressor [Clostridia bacterium]
MTKQRKLIYDIIMASAEHLTAEEIFLLAKKVYPSIAFATVYRNLGLMVTDGEIAKVERHDSPTRYDKLTLPHCHGECAMCGKVYDVKVEGLREFLSAQVDNLAEYELIIKGGLCEVCRQKKFLEK